MRPDAIVVGGGLIGLCSARALAARGWRVRILHDPRAGEASAAAAGMLAPSVERATGPAHAFAISARDRFPDYLRELEDLTGINVPLNRLGILQVALSAAGVRGLRKTAPQGSTWLEPDALRALEPALAHALGAVMNPDDGAVDNKVLLEALRQAVASTPGITLTHDAVVSLPDGSSGSVLTGAGETISAAVVIIAAGAWSGSIRGAPLGTAVEPVKGQLLAYRECSLRHVVYGPTGYLVPRGGGTIAGSTMERVGFNTQVTDAAMDRLRETAKAICPALATAKPFSAWAGLRPVTPDGLPLLGADPDRPSVIYACGHGRNGVLMAPLTGDVVADLVTGKELRHDLTQFRPDRSAC